MAQYDVTTAGAVFEPGVSLDINSCFIIDGTHFIDFFATAQDNTVQVFAVNTSTWAVTTANNSLQFETDENAQQSCFVIDSNHFINFWGSATNTAGSVQVFTVNTSTWAVTTANSSLAFGATYADYNACYQIDANHFINFYQDTGVDGFVNIFTVNTTTWAVTTATTALEFDTRNCYSNSCCKVDTNHFINFWGGGVAGATGLAQMFVVNTSTWAVTTSAASLTFDTAWSTGNFSSHACYLVDSNHVVLFYAGSGTDGYAQVFAINTSTWEVTTASAGFEFDTANGNSNSCYKVDTNHFINYWSGLDSDGYAQVFTVNTSTWEITTSGASVEFDTQFGLRNSCAQIDASHYINFWKGGTGSTGRIQIFNVELASSSFIKTINGLAKASVKTVDGLAIASVKSWNGLT